MSVDIVAENALAATYNFTQMQTSQLAGDVSVAGFARRPSVNVGETIEFAVTGGATQIDIFRVGYYGGGGFRLVTTITNTPTAQPAATTIPSTNGANTCTSWTTTASWTVPAGAVSGMYMAAVRSIPPNAPDYFYITFVVRDDDAVADIIYKTSDTTWQAAYNHYGTPASPTSGKNVYGSGTGIGNILDRAFAVSYHRPVITRGTVQQTYWWACELPLIRFLERNGFTVKYITSVDLDQQGASILENGTVFLSSGHDEYWTENMRDAVEEWRDQSAGRSIFMSGNEVFWKARFEYVGDEARMYCYKDTMPGPTGFTRNPGDPLDPVEWTGTWKDTRWPGRRPEWFLTGTDFRMNGVNDFDAIVLSNPYGGHPVWGGSSLVDGNVTFQRAIGFEADSARPTQPSVSVRMLAAYTRNINGAYADDNGQNYSGNGDLTWGIVSQRYRGGGVTVGFGTCQWSWVLDSTHDRFNGSPVQLAAQQFTVNLLRGLGAEPATVMAGVSTAVIPPTLDDFGLEPPESPQPFDAVYVGTSLATAVHVGETLVWP